MIDQLLFSFCLVVSVARRTQKNARWSFSVISFFRRAKHSIVCRGIFTESNWKFEYLTFHRKQFGIPSSFSDEGRTGKSMRHRTSRSFTEKEDVSSRSIIEHILLIFLVYSGLFIQKATMFYRNYRHSWKHNFFVIDRRCCRLPLPITIDMQFW